MKATNVEIAGLALCSETAVRGAIERKRLDSESLESVVGFVLCMRLKQLGLMGVDDLVKETSLPSGVQKGCAGIGETSNVPCDDQGYEL